MSPEQGEVGGISLRPHSFMQSVDDCVILVKMNPYDYTSNASQFNLQLKKENTDWRHYTVDFPAAFPTRYKENHIARGEYFQPTGTDTAPLVIMLHGVGDHSVVPCRFLARNLAKQGIASLVLYLVVHSSRKSEGLRKGIRNLSDDDWFEIYRTSVIEVRQIVDWASSRPEIDEGRIAVFGISFGGFISAITMGIDERIRAGVFFVSGGNSGKIAHKARSGVISRGYRSSEAEYIKTQDNYARYLAEVDENGFEGTVPIRNSFLMDSMTYAHHLRQRPVLMINAKWDVFIPREATEDFWQRCGQPEIVWLAGGHSSIWLWYPLIKQRMNSFLRSAFGM
ncbi:MAG: alpha/beta hydrolase family protein [Dehalococcoidales bacterium]|nr:MAG: alpha/beta hydrolase family protein [Dehalococcoidales bacterium]